MTIKDKFLSKPISELDLSGCEVGSSTSTCRTCTADGLPAWGHCQLAVPVWLEGPSSCCVVNQQYLLFDHQLLSAHINST
jgi:hypothetical protein